MKTTLNILLIMTFTSISITISAQCVQCDENSSASGNYASVIGMSTTATSDGAFAGGFNSHATGFFSYAFGNQVTAFGANSLAIGRFLETGTSEAFVLGIGNGVDNKLMNNVSHSLMIGFNSTKPTFFVGMSDGAELTGKVGIGNVSEPLAKLHIKADAGEDVDILLEPGSQYKYARIIFGGTNRIEAKESSDLTFYTAEDFYFSGGNVGINTFLPSEKLDVNGTMRVRGNAKFEENVGIGTNTPQEALEVNGKIKSSGSNSAIILESPDGTEWEIKVDNNGNLTTNQIAMIPEKHNKYDIKIFPNPATNTISIEIQSDKIHSFDAEIYDLNGKMIFMRNYKTNNSQIDVNNFSKGIYILNIKGDNGTLLKSEKIAIE